MKHQEFIRSGIIFRKIAHYKTDNITDDDTLDTRNLEEENATYIQSRLFVHWINLLPSSTDNHRLAESTESLFSCHEAEHRSGNLYPARV